MSLGTCSSSASCSYRVFIAEQLFKRTYLRPILFKMTLLEAAYRFNVPSPCKIAFFKPDDHESFARISSAPNRPSKLAATKFSTKLCTIRLSPLPAGLCWPPPSADRSYSFRIRFFRPSLLSASFVCPVRNSHFIFPNGTSLPAAFA